MSVSNLLDPLTLNQEWSKLYCNELNALTIVGGGAPVMQDSIISVPDLSFGNASTGVFGNPESTISIIEHDGKNWVNLNLAFEISALQAPLPDGGAQSVAVIYIDLPSPIIYPTVDLRNLPGSINSDCIDGNTYIMTTCNMKRNSNGTQLRIAIHFNTNITATPVTLQLGLSAHYRVN